MDRIYTRVAQNIPKAQGFGPSGMWDAEERLRALGPLPHEPRTAYEIEREYLILKTGRTDD